MESNSFRYYLDQSAIVSTIVSTKKTERELEIIARKEGNSIEVQKIKEKILMIKAKSWFGTIIGGYIVEKYYQWKGQI